MYDLPEGNRPVNQIVFVTAIAVAFSITVIFMDNELFAFG